MKHKGKKRRLLVMGDIHGHFDKMREALEKSEYHSGLDRLVLLGDYVDRGSCSRQVLDKVVQLVYEGAVALKGNHEEMMLATVKRLVAGNIHPTYMEQWFANGGEATLHSYKEDRDCLAAHLEFLKTLPVLHEEGGYLFVHAGVRPGLPLDKQSIRDMIWIREEYIDEYDGPWKVVAGHTPTSYLNRKDVTAVEDGYRPIIRRNQIFMDTGVAWGGKLSVMELPSGKYWQA